MFFHFKNNERDRFRQAFADELLEYHFEQVLGKNPHNVKKWGVLVEERIEPHTEILCNFSDWLISRGWNKDVVEELFFVVSRENERNAKEKTDTPKEASWLRSFFRIFKP